MSLINYIRDTRGELKHVSWPTKKQAIAFTVLVIFVSVGVSLYLGIFDALFTYILEKIVL